MAPTSPPQTPIPANDATKTYFGAFGTNSPNNEPQPVHRKEPGTRIPVTADSAVAKELGDLFQKTQDRLMQLHFKHVGNQNDNEQHDNEESVSAIEPKTDQADTEMDNSGANAEVESVNLTPQSSTFAASSSDPGAALSSAQASDGSSRNEAARIWDIFELDDPFEVRQTPHEQEHCFHAHCRQLTDGYHMFGCANKEIILVYNSERLVRVSFFVCAITMKRVSRKWSHSSSNCWFTATPITVTVNCMSDDIVEAAKILFGMIHWSPEDLGSFSFSIRADILVQMTAIALRLGCECVLHHWVRDFLTTYDEDVSSCLDQHVLHNILFLSETFEHEKSFGRAAKNLATRSPCPPPHTFGTLWAGITTEPFVHTEIVPILHAIWDASAQAEHHIISEINCFATKRENHHHDYQEDFMDVASYHLYHSLMAYHMWPLVNSPRLSLKMFVDKIKDVCGEDPDYQDISHDMNWSLEQLYHDLDNIVSRIEFPLCCF